MDIYQEKFYLRGQCHTPRDQRSTRSISGGHHTELARGNELAEILDLLLDGGLVDVLGLVGVCGLGASVCV